MANVSEDEGSIVFARPAPGLRFNPTRREFETVDPYHLAASRAKIDTFLESLPALSLADLPEDNMECPICTEPYRVSQDGDIPVRLSCSHIIGKDCLSKWLNSSLRNANNDRCPTCRTVLFTRYRPVVEPRGPTVQEILASLRFDVIGYLRAQEHERTLEEYTRIRNALNAFRARMDGAASREARGLIRLLNSHGATVLNQLASLRADVDRYARAQQHERTFEEFSRINHALTELMQTPDGAARGEFFNLVLELHQAFQSARPVQMQRVRDGRTEPVNQNAPIASETQAPGGAREIVHGQEVANPMRTAPDGTERFDQNDSDTVREVPERSTARESSGNEGLADDNSTNDEYDSPQAGRARLRAHIEEMSRIQTLLERNSPLERHYPQIAAPRHAQGVPRTRANRPGEPGATGQRHASLIAEIGNQQRAVAEHSERLNRAHTARRPPHVERPSGRSDHLGSTGIFGTPVSTSEERRRAAAERFDNRSSGIFGTPANFPEEQMTASAERLASRRNDEDRFILPGRETRTNNLARPAGLNATPTRANQPQVIPQERPRVAAAAAATAQQANRGNREMRFTIPRLQPRRSPTYASINDHLTAIDASLTRMENQQRILAQTLERLDPASVARVRSAVPRGAGTGGEDVRVPADQLRGGGVREQGNGGRGDPLAFVDARIERLTEGLTRVERQWVLDDEVAGMAGRRG